MITIKRTDSSNLNFQELVRELDEELKVRDGDDHLFYAELNKIAVLKYVIIAFEENEVVGCGALRELTDEVIEIKRMFVPLHHRNKGIASQILKALEQWAYEIRMSKCILETGKNQPEAIRLYQKCGYKRIANYGKYEYAENSVCFEKLLVAE